MRIAAALLFTAVPVIDRADAANPPVASAPAAPKQAPAGNPAPAAGSPPATTATAAPVPAIDLKVPSPVPGALAEEKAHIARYDAAIMAVREHQISADDAANLKAAVGRVSARDLAGIQATRDKIADPIGRKLVDWSRLRAGIGEAREYREFLAANPAWASRELLIQRYEEALFTEGGAPATLKALFKTEQPRTGAGYAALAAAHLADGDTAGGQRLARTAWRDHVVSSSLEATFLDRFREQITAADHKWRLDRLLMDDPRWTNDRNDRAAQIRRIIPLLPDAERKKADARLAAFLKAANAGALLAALPVEQTPDWGLAFQRIQVLRRAGKIDEAAKLMLSAPLDQAVIVSPDGWWGERRALAYALLREGNPKLAYEIVKSAGPLSANPLKDQSFLAGWLALSHLKDPASARGHFDTFRKTADGPLSQAKAAYWMGRVQEVQGRNADAKASFTDAARHIDTFHGQLSRRKLGADAHSIRVVYPAAPTADQIAKFSKLDAARAAVIARKAGLDISVSRGFMAQLHRYHTTEAEVGMVAHLAEALGDTQAAVRVAKAGIARGFNLVVFGYPLHAFPAFTALKKPTPEMAMLLGIARQESEFNGTTLSGAGARGILQVMPITARHVCRDYRIKCDIPRLMTDNAYNTMMAAAYIGDRMGEFKGSYVLGIAGYNAGPGRARQWIREFGDPRDPSVDVIDWIHRIPFEETRDYVQKVLSNIQVYRARLGHGAVKLAIVEDLMRARGLVGGAEPQPGDAGANGALKGDDAETRSRVFD